LKKFALLLLFLGGPFSEAQQARRPQPRIPEGVTVQRNLDYAGTGNPCQQLDLYLPKQRKGDGPLPVVCWIHGGGWQQGDRANANRIHALVASGEYAGVSIGYRLSSEAQWPAQIHDCKAAIRWVRAHADEHGLDPDRIAAWGSSAGGHLVAMLGTTHGNAGLEGKIGPHLDHSSELRCIINYYGPADLLSMNRQAPPEAKFDHDAPNSPESRMLGGALQHVPGKARNASPLFHVSADDEAFLIVHGTQDLLVPYAQSVAFEKKLERAGVKAVFLTVDGGGHGAGFGGPVVKSYVRRFLEIHLHGKAHALDDATVGAGE